MFDYSLRIVKSQSVTQSCLILFYHMDQAPLSVEFSRQEYWSGLHSLLQSIFLTQSFNLGLLYCRQIVYCLSQQGSPFLRIGC